MKFLQHIVNYSSSAQIEQEDIETIQRCLELAYKAKSVQVPRLPGLCRLDPAAQIKSIFAHE